MNINGNKIVDTIKKNAGVAAWFASIAGQSMETGNSISDAINYLLLGTERKWTNEVMQSFSDLNYLRHKLLEAKHTPQAFLKMGALVWGASKLGILNSSWGNTAKDIMKGAAVAALMLPASSPQDFSSTNSIRQNFSNAPIMAEGGYPY